MFLKNILSQISSYDFIFIDCPPALGLLTINSLVAANSVIIPLQCEFFALEGLSALNTTIETIKSNLNKSLFIEGVVLTMFDKRNTIKLFGRTRCQKSSLKTRFTKQLFQEM